MSTRGSAVVRRLTVVALTLLLVVAAGGPASAQTKKRMDAVGDAPALMDLRSVKVQNGAKRFVVTVRVSEVRRGRTGLGFAIGRSSNTEAHRVEHYVIVLPQGRRWVAGAGSLTTEDERPWACERLRTTFRTGRNGWIRVSFPQRCLGDRAGRQRVNVMVGDVESGGVGAYLPDGDATEPDDGDQLKHVITAKQARRG
ncbi:hypothetical protein [Solicola sp. PLA-1-18]|uniref:hypothetical protein n=1 Tax=Solicola sp. PLA-1-18 TaxID=3380532 RepID=UPI003B774EA0